MGGMLDQRGRERVGLEKHRIDGEMFGV